MKLKFVGLTDAGRIRANNEDAISTLEPLGLAVLADGMGGYNAGEVASAMAVEHIRQHLQPWLTARPVASRELPQAVLRGIELANQAIYEASAAHREFRGMGTTVVVAVFHGSRVLLAHAGDSRVYRLRQGQLVTLTRDHSLLQEQIDAGLISPELARHATYRNLVTRAVGVEAAVRPDLNELGTEPGDLYLLCSDGLNDMLSDEEIASVLLRTPSLEAAARALVDAANAAGGRDNISVILAQVQPDTPSTD